MKEFPSNEGVKEGTPLKGRYFATISSSSVKTVADRYRYVAILTNTGHGLLKCVNIADLERPWTPKGVF